MSIIEQEREISASVLKTYLVNPELDHLPALANADFDRRTFNSEREILYQILFDMRKDINDLKKLVPELSKINSQVPTDLTHHACQHPVNQEIAKNIIVEEPVPYADEYTEEETKEPEPESNLSLDEVEKEMIRKALERNKGKRRNAALELKISERTLYRKIKEYELE
jgi:transcriptional regulator with PAS, ATPase and Fis domain